MEPDYLDDLKAVLCDPEGACCISGSEMDREIIDRCLRGIARQKEQLKQRIAHLQDQRRERIATAAMTSVMNALPDGHGVFPQQVALLACQLADALIAELDRGKV